MTQSEKIPVRKKKKRRRRLSPWPAVISIFIMLCIFVGIIFYQNYKKLNGLSGRWTAKIEMTDEIVTNSIVWLSDIQNAEINREWVKSKCDPIEVEVVLNVNKTEGSKGTYDISVDMESYENCKKQAYDLVADCIKDIVLDRLTKLGYEDISADELNELITQVLGNDLDEYLQDKTGELIPSYEDIALTYEQNGEYEVDGKEIVLTHGSESERKSLLFDDKNLVIGDAPTVYRKQVEP